MPNFEPAVMLWHRGKLQIACDILKQLKELYKGTVVADKMDDAYHLVNSADSELIKMTDKKNQELFDQYQKEFNGGA